MIRNCLCVFATGVAMLVDLFFFRPTIRVRSARKVGVRILMNVLVFSTQTSSSASVNNASSRRGRASLGIDSSSLLSFVCPRIVVAGRASERMLQDELLKLAVLGRIRRLRECPQRSPRPKEILILIGFPLFFTIASLVPFHYKYPEFLSK